MALEITPDGFLFRRGVGFGALLILALPVLIGIKALLYGYFFGPLWVGLLG